MGWARQCYYGTMQIERPEEGTYLMPVVWYFAPPGAERFRGSNSFVSGLNDRDRPALPPQLGAQPPYRRQPYDGRNVWGYAGKCQVGTPEMFAFGLTAAELAAPVPPVPYCCAGLLAPIDQVQTQTATMEIRWTSNLDQVQSFGWLASGIELQTSRVQLVLPVFASELQSTTATYQYRISPHGGQQQSSRALVTVLARGGELQAARARLQMPEHAGQIQSSRAIVEHEILVTASELQSSKTQLISHNFMGEKQSAQVDFTLTIPVTGGQKQSSSVEIHV